MTNGVRLPPESAVGRPLGPLVANGPAPPAPGRAPPVPVAPEGVVTPVLPPANEPVPETPPPPVDPRASPPVSCWPETWFTDAITSLRGMRVPQAVRATITA